MAKLIFISNENRLSFIFNFGTKSIMTRYVVLGGYGEMGKIASRDLAETAKNSEIIIVGRDLLKADAYAKYLAALQKTNGNKNTVTARAADAKDKEKLATILKGADVCVNCSQYSMNLEVMNACLKAGCHYLDLGGLYHMTLKQLKLHSQFKKKNLIAILGCGSTPGITNVMAGHGAKYFDKIHEIKVRFGGYDYTKYKWHFVVPYSMYTVFEEFSDKPALFTKGKMKFVEPVSNQEKEIFPQPVGEVTCFATLHSELATFPISFNKKGIQECSFKLAFPEDFVHDVKFMIDTGMNSREPIEVGGRKIVPVDVTVKELSRFTPDHAGVLINDLEYVRVRISGKVKGKDSELTIDCLTKSDSHQGTASGGLDTGVPPSIIAQMIASREINEIGVLPPEICVPAQKFFEELKKRKMTIYETWKKEIN